MEIKYNVSGAKRKEMVGIISKTVGVDAVYKFMPTCNYEIDYFTVTKDGTLLFDDSSDTEIVEKVIEDLAAAGFETEETTETVETEITETAETTETETTEIVEAETTETAEAETTETAETEITETAETETTETAETETTETAEVEITETAEAETTETAETETTEIAETETTETAEAETTETAETETEQNKQTAEAPIEFSIPLGNTDKRTIENFAVMIYSKQYLINKAVGFEVIKIPFDAAELNASGIAASDFKGFKITSENITFYYPKADEKLKAYMDLMNKAWIFAKKSKQLQTKLIEPENEKYYMRSWLVRIGFGGKEGAETRKMLIRDLKGHSAFRTQEEIDKAKEKYRASRNKE